jgi:hypothetical protein
LAVTGRPTDVAQYSVQGDLVNVTLAARADLRDQPSEQPLLSHGQWAVIGLGLVVVLSSCGLSRSSKSTQDSEDDPWQVQYRYAA